MDSTSHIQLNKHVLVFVGKTSLFKVPLWSTWLVWGIVTIIIIGVLLFRKHLQKAATY